MERIEFSELTNRLHRNLVGLAALIIGIRLFDIKIGHAAALGVELINVTTGVLLITLTALLFYHAVAFGVRAFEEFRQWELDLTGKRQTYYGGAIGVSDLAGRLVKVGDALERILGNTGRIKHRGQDVFTEEDGRELRAVMGAASLYAKRFDNFPNITRWRFLLWDVGVAGLITIVAILFAFGALPTGQELFCTGSVLTP